MSFDLYALPSRVKEQAEYEYVDFKKKFPYLSEEQLRSMALSAAGASGKLAMLYRPEDPKYYESAFGR